MFKKFLIALAVPVLFTACLKSDNKSNTCPYEDLPIVAPATEVATLRDSLSARGISVVAHPSGLFYAIDLPGNGAVATACSTVTVHYKGQLLDGSVFEDSRSNPANAAGVSFVLGQLIPGWVKGIPFIQPGGKIRLYLPPTLAYGTQARPGIPANSNLIFTIDLIAVQ